jgi:hypothetical protein
MASMLSAGYVPLEVSPFILCYAELFSMRDTSVRSQVFGKSIDRL